MIAVPSNALRYFLAVTKAGSFRRAAQQLHISASAISRQISLLESELGLPLFERSRGRGQLKVTSAGQIFLNHAKAATGELEQARSEIESLKGLRLGTISLGVPEMFVHDFLPDLILRFRKLYPGISFWISVDTPNKLTEQLLADEIEVAMIYQPPVRASIHIAAKIQRPNCIMVSADHPLAKRKSVRLVECVAYPLVMPSYGTRAREMYEAFLAGMTAEPSWIITTTSYEMLRSMAGAGLGAAIVSDYLIGKARPSGAVLVPLRDCPPSILACCTHSGRNLSIAAATFVQHIRDALLSLDRRASGR